MSDLLVAVLVMPWRAASDTLGFWPFGAFCDLWVAFDIMCCAASLLHRCLISVERYWAIASPFHYQRRVTKSVALATIVVVWLLSLLISFIPVQLQWHKDWELPSKGQLELNDSVEEESCDSSLSRIYAISSSLISFCIPVAIMLGTHGRLFLIARRRLCSISSLERVARRTRGCPGISDCPRGTPLKNSLRKETKVLQTLSIIMGAFVCCWLPFFVLSCLVPFCNAELRLLGALPCVSGAVLGTFTCLGWANSALNPIIYAFTAEFRRAFASLLGWGCLCPGSAVETVTCSKELVSFHPDTADHRAGETLSHPQLWPTLCCRWKTTRWPWMGFLRAPLPLRAPLLSVEPRCRWGGLPCSPAAPPFESELGKGRSPAEREAGTFLPLPVL